MKKFGKKLLMVAMTTALAVTSVVGLTACGNNNNAPTTNNKPAAKDVYSMAAVSSASVLGNTLGSQTGQALATAAVRPEGITDATVDSLKEYLVMFGDMLVNDGFVTDTTDPSPEVDGAKYGTYKSKIAVTVKDDTYKIYYNETAEDGTDVDPDDDDDEVETTLEGVLVVGEEEYTVEGKREVETEDEEQEVEIEFTTIKEDGSKVTVKQEIEADEVSYGYTIYNEKGKKVYEYEIEYETEKDGSEMEVEIVDLSSGSKVKTEFEVKAISENELEIKHKEKANGNKVKNTIKVTKNSDTEYVFNYNNNEYEEVVTIDQPAKDENVENSDSTDTQVDEVVA